MESFIVFFFFWGDTHWETEEWVMLAFKRSPLLCSSFASRTFHSRNHHQIFLFRIHHQQQKQKHYAPCIKRIKMMNVVKWHSSTPAAKSTPSHSSSSSSLLTAAPSHSHSQSHQDWQIIRHLARYLWPHDSPSVKARVIISIALLLAGKGLNVLIPYSFKHVVDSLTLLTTTSSASTDAVSAVSSAGDPILLLSTAAGAALLAYGGARLGSSLFSEIKNVRKKEG